MIFFPEFPSLGPTMREGRQIKLKVKSVMDICVYFFIFRNTDSLQISLQTLEKIRPVKNTRYGKKGA